MKLSFFTLLFLSAFISFSQNIDTLKKTKWSANASFVSDKGWLTSINIHLHFKKQHAVVLGPSIWLSGTRISGFGTLSYFDFLPGVGINCGYRYFLYYSYKSKLNFYLSFDNNTHYAKDIVEWYQVYISSPPVEKINGTWIEFLVGPGFHYRFNKFTLGSNWAFGSNLVLVFFQPIKQYEVNRFPVLQAKFEVLF